MSEYLDIGIKAVKEAEKEIMKIFNSQINITIKPDATPVTNADKNAEKIIRNVISEKYPDHNFYGEEFGQCDPTKGYVWVIDPIDGTKSFMRKMPFFATLLALLKDGEFIIGIANFPCYNELFTAEKGRGAFLNGKKIKVSDVSDTKVGLMSHANILCFQRIGKVDELFELAAMFMTQRGYPGPDSHHLVLKGQCELALDPNVQLYDVAPFKVLIEEAGGKCYNMNGKPFKLGDNNFVSTNGKIDDKIVPILQRKII